MLVCNSFLPWPILERKSIACIFFLFVYFLNLFSFNSLIACVKDSYFSHIIVGYIYFRFLKEVIKGSFNFHSSRDLLRKIILDSYDDFFSLDQYRLNDFENGCRF